MLQSKIIQSKNAIKIYPYGDFPGGPEVKTCASTAGGTRSICGWGTKTLHAVQHSLYKCTYIHICVCLVTSVASDFLWLWTVACQLPLSMGFSKKEYWSHLLHCRWLHHCWAAGKAYIYIYSLYIYIYTHTHTHTHTYTDCTYKLSNRSKKV